MLLRTRLLPSHIYHHACLLSTSAAPFSLEDYLVAACGLAPDQARNTAKKAFDESSRLSKKPFEELSRSRLESASNPAAIIALLSGVGLARTDIAAIVAADPLLPRSSPKKIGPRLLDLRDRVGLSTPQIVRFLLVASRALRTCDVGPSVKFFISFFGSFDRFLVIVKNNNRLISSDLERVVKPNLALLRQCGQSDRDIAQLCPRTPWLLRFNPERVKEILVRAEELGVSRSSRMFRRAVSVAAKHTKEKVAARVKFLTSTLGCHESEVATAVSKMPSTIEMSEECLRLKIQFLINEVGLDKQYIL